MAIRSVTDIKTTRRIGISWMVVSITGSLAAGILRLSYVTKTQGDMQDPETIFIYLLQILFHPLISGFLLGAIIAAIMSTISSQLLVTAGRISVALVALVAFFLAYDRESTILDLVNNAWAGFGVAFGPVVLINLL